MKLPVRRMRGARFLLVCAAVGVAVLGATAVVASRAAASPAVNTKLFAYDGEPDEPYNGIWLKDANGALVTHLDPGTYEIEVDDHSALQQLPSHGARRRHQDRDRLCRANDLDSDVHRRHLSLPLRLRARADARLLHRREPAACRLRRLRRQSVSCRRSWASHLRRRRGDSALHIVDRAPCVTDSHASGPASSIGRVGSPAPDFLTERRLVCA